MILAKLSYFRIRVMRVATYPTTSSFYMSLKIRIINRKSLI